MSDISFGKTTTDTVRKGLSPEDNILAIAVPSWLEPVLAKLFGGATVAPVVGGLLITIAAGQGVLLLTDMELRQLEENEGKRKALKKVLELTVAGIQQFEKVAKSQNKKPNFKVQITGSTTKVTFKVTGPGIDSLSLTPSDVRNGSRQLVSFKPDETFDVANLGGHWLLLHQNGKIFTLK